VRPKAAVLIMRPEAAVLICLRPEAAVVRPKAAVLVCLRPEAAVVRPRAADRSFHMRPKAAVCSVAQRALVCRAHNLITADVIQLLSARE
jgi:hypothetical protein